MGYVKRHNFLNLRRSLSYSAYDLAMKRWRHAAGEPDLLYSNLSHVTFVGAALLSGVRENSLPA
jgi:hypothetical protein